MKKTLIVILGPTAIGKTVLALNIANKFNSEIISADSRQFYKELNIGVAKPTADELSAVKHHFIGNLSLSDYYNVSRFENEVISFLKSYFQAHNFAVMVGGSGLYINAVCSGIDDLPDPDKKLREELKVAFEKEGIEPLTKQLKKLDPEYYKTVDLENPNRVMRALEVIIMTGQTYTSLRTNKSKKRDFEIIKIGLNRPRPELFNIIENRIDKMIQLGLVDEVKGLLKFNNLNSLNTVGYKEIFEFLDGEYSLNEAIEKIKTNTRRYAKRQLTWFKKDGTINWFHPDDQEEIVKFINNILSLP